MRWNCAMMSLRVTLLVEEEEADVDGAKKVGGTADPDRLDWNYASLRLIVTASIAPIIEKWFDKGKGIEKWRKILVIAKGNMSLSRDAESRMNIYNRKNEMKREVYSKMLKKRQ